MWICSSRHSARPGRGDRRGISSQKSRIAWCNGGTAKKMCPRFWRINPTSLRIICSRMDKNREITGWYFRKTTTIEFSFPNTSDGMLKIFKGLGEEVAVLVSSRLTAGYCTYQWSRPVWPHSLSGARRVWQGTILTGGQASSTNLKIFKNKSIEFGFLGWMLAKAGLEQKFAEIYFLLINYKLIHYVLS